ncbi:MAG: ComEA family DNA-binding protein [Anaerolineales bacterium]|jgi:competence protein ComEA
MLQKLITFVGGLFMGLFSAGLLLLLIRPHPRYSVKLYPAPTQGPIQIHVAGAVNAPGVVQLAPGSIVEQAINAAGGPAEEADLSRINLAQELRDGEQVYIPLQTQTTPKTDAIQSESETNHQILNINTADAVQLEQLPGIGPSLATSIVEYREEHGWFQETDELLNVSGIGPAKLDQIDELITFH